MCWLTVNNSTFPSSYPWKHDQSYWTSFELYPEWSGRNFYIFKGKAYHQLNYWSGAVVAVKTFREIHATTNDWSTYKRRCEEARKMAANFNMHLASITSDIQLSFVKPVDVVMENISDVMKITRLFVRFDKKFTKNEVVLFEDMLEGDFKTFVTNRGFTTGYGSDILDAFCHFTYHSSNGHLVICNLKGIEIYKGRLQADQPHDTFGRWLLW